MRPPKPPEERQVKISGTVKRPVFDWLEERIKSGHFYNRSHAIQEGLRLLKEAEEDVDPVNTAMVQHGLVKRNRR